MKTAVLITIGDEILRGKILDSNVTYIARELHNMGIKISEHVVVPDDIDVIVATLNRMKTDVMILTGGLGPTPDDMTRYAIAKYLGTELELRESEFDSIKQRFLSRGITMSPSNEIQAMIPIGANVIPNPVGMAPGIMCKKDKTTLISLPGVPQEMKAMLQNVLSLFNLPQVGSLRMLRTIAYPESSLYDALDISEYQNEIGFYPSLGFVDIVFSPKVPEKELEKIRVVLKDHIYSNGKRIEEVIQDLMKNQTLSVAESCTGGMIASSLVDIAGSSQYFSGGIIAYSNDIKEEILGASKQDLEEVGAVSPEIAKQMAQGCQKFFSSDVALATTGISGPEGGTPEKPVGLVYIALATDKETYVRKYLISKTRNGNRQRTCSAALYLLWLHLTDRLKDHNFLDGSIQA